MLLSITLFACVSPSTLRSTESGPYDSPVADSAETADSGLTETAETGSGDSPTDTEVDTDSGSNSGSGTAHCPEGMSLIGDDPATQFCIHTYEPVVTGNFGDKDQYATGAVPPSDIVMTSTAGVIPTVGYSTDQAFAFCDGLGWHLATYEEWRLAAVGGSDDAYPYGDTYDPEACATLTTVPSQEIQLTGSFSSCVSRNGVYDQIGNIWEWVDSEQTVDASAFFANMSAKGAHISEGDDGSVQMDPASVNLSRLMIAGPANNATLSLDTEGNVIVTISSSTVWNDQDSGFLTYGWDGSHNADSTPTLAENDLPIQIILDDTPSTSAPYQGHLVVNHGLDGTPLVAKVGAADYVGEDPSQYTVDYVYIGHLHDFDATAGGRCVTTPSYD